MRCGCKNAVSQTVRGCKPRFTVISPDTQNEIIWKGGWHFDFLHCFVGIRYFEVAIATFAARIDGPTVAVSDCKAVVGSHPCNTTACMDELDEIGWER